MVAEELRRAVTAAPIAKLRELAGALWKAFGAGLVTEEEAQALAEAIEARKAVPTPAPAPRRRTGSRPRSPESVERRRRQATSGWLPPQLATRFTLAEMAVLAVVAAEVARRGLCRLTIGHVAALAGVGRSTVKAALREARTLGLLSVEEWRIEAWRNAPNTVRLLSAEWKAWVRMRRRPSTKGPRDVGAIMPGRSGSRAGGGVKTSTATNTDTYQEGSSPKGSRCRSSTWRPRAKADVRSASQGISKSGLPTLREVPYRT